MLSFARMTVIAAPPEVRGGGLLRSFVRAVACRVGAGWLALMAVVIGCRCS